MNIDLLIKDSFMIPLEILEICKKKKKPHKWKFLILVLTHMVNVCLWRNKHLAKAATWGVL